MLQFASPQIHHRKSAFFEVSSPPRIRSKSHPSFTHEELFLFEENGCRKKNQAFRFPEVVTRTTFKPIPQKKVVTKQSVLEEFKIHPKNFALARAMAGDASDNLPGIKGAGLKTIAKRFPWLVREDVYEVSDIIRECAMQGKKLKLHENIEANEKLVKDNYQIMQLYFPNIRPVNRMMIDKAITDFEPYFDKIKFTQMLFEDSAGHLNFNDLQAVFRKINN